MRPRIFVVEDEADIARLVKHHLESAGHEVQVFASTSWVIREATARPPALFVLDIMIPGGDGMELCKQIRQIPTLSKLPVIFLTAKTKESERIAGFEVGADDYVSKPFSPRELVARVKAILRRFEKPLQPVVTNIGRLEIDGSAMILRVAGKIVETTATEFRLLNYFATNPSRVFTRDQLLDAVWQDTSFVNPRTVDVYIRRLREKIEENPEEPMYIRTVRGAGYRFEAGR